MCQANAALHILHHRAYGHFNLAQSSKRCVYAIELCKREGAKEVGTGWSLALSLPLLWCHKCEPELWIFTSVQRTNPMSIKGYRAAAKEQEWRQGGGRPKETLCDVDFCVIFIAFKLAGSACWFYCGYSRFIRERARERESGREWTEIWYFMMFI